MYSRELQDARRSLLWAIGGLAVAVGVGFVVEPFRNPLMLLAATLTGAWLGLLPKERWHSWRFVGAVASTIIVVAAVLFWAWTRPTMMLGFT